MGKKYYCKDCDETVPANAAKIHGIKSDPPCRVISVGEDSRYTLVLTERLDQKVVEGVLNGSWNQPYPEMARNAAVDLLKWLDGNGGT